MSSAVILYLTGGVGCIAPQGTPSITSHNPQLKIPAIETAVDDHDCSHVSQMVRDLDSEDAAVRFYSVQGLRRLTGDAFGYHFYDDDAARRPAVKRWRAWLSQFEAGRNLAKT